MAWLARAGLTDATLRWTAPNPCPANLVFPGPGGCFSMSGLVGLLTSSISAAASAGVAGSSTVSFVRVSVVSYIPNLVSTLDKPNRRVRGVGLVFALDLKARIAVDPSSVGLPPLPLGAPAPPIPLSPWHYVTAYIPIALLFESDGANGLQFSLDPFDLAGSLAGSEMINHLAVEVTPVLGDTPVANLIAEAVLNGLPAAGSLPATPGLRSILSTPIAGTTLASNALSGFFTAARARAAPLSSDFEVLLAPAPNGPVGTPVSPALSPLGGLPGVDLVFLESRG